MRFKLVALTLVILTGAPVELGSKSDIKLENSHKLREPPKHHELVRLHTSLQYLILRLTTKAVDIETPFLPVSINVTFTKYHEKCYVLRLSDFSNQFQVHLLTLSRFFIKTSFS